MKNIKLLSCLAIICICLAGCGNVEDTDLMNEVGTINNTQLTEPESTQNNVSDLVGTDKTEDEVLSAVVDTEVDDVIKITTDTGEKIEIDKTLETTEAIKNEDGSVTYTTEDGTEVNVKEDGTATVTPAPIEKPTSTPTPEPVHNHSYTSKITKEATCTSKGVKTYSCDCGDSYTEEIEKTAHNEGNWTVIKAATCKTTGTKIKTCTVCGVELDSAAIEKTGHTASDWTTTKTATCQATGTKVKTCTVCNTELETAIIEKSSDHTYTWTHVANGDYKVNICSGCGTESGNRAYNLGNGIYGYYDNAAAVDLFEKVNGQRNNSHTVVRDEVTNEVIGGTNIPSLIWRDEEIAKKRALDIVTNFSHEGYLTDNENLARGQGTAVEVSSAWYNSDTHFQTMTSIQYVYGSTACLWVDSDSKGTMYPYWTLVLSIQ